MDNIEVAILTKVNELAQSYGVKPYEFVATLANDSDSCDCRLTFQLPSETSDEQHVKVRQMLNSIGVDNKGDLRGSEIVLINTLEEALQRAPKPRGRY